MQTENEPTNNPPAEDSNMKTPQQSKSPSETQPQSPPSKKTKVPRPKDTAYLYDCVVENIVDGDTLLIRIDLGFDVWKQQRIRLADIDCPPLDTPKGQEAADYVRARMAKADMVMVRTHKVDVYGRYVGHIFYVTRKDGHKENVFRLGRFLNQELVNKGFATVQSFR